MAEEFDRIREIFDAAVGKDPGSRASILEDLCAGDAALRRRVEALLDAHDRTGGSLDPLIQPTVTDLSATDPSERIGPYRLLRRIGEGGMGVVWLAEQTEPLRRQVALKVIKAGMDTAQVIARFEAERQALALMDHPAIAKVHDAGATPRGLPYFAMEHVHGEPVTAYCDRHRLTTQQRLELFSQVCEGVQHAHQKGVIHRDLKPSNVLVTIVGERPMPKIIDFGVAKAIAQRLTERTMFTDLGVLIGTPEYMSPEQAELTGLDVDTRTDVYALGVMLYELLTGVLPFESKQLRQAGFEEIRRVIREVDPVRPSTRVRTLGERSTQAARDRATEPGRLASGLKGDLDWIVMKALEKDRTRRYGSPAELAADLERHLRHEPVVAGPPSAAYRARKFARRHRFGVAVATVALVALVGFSMMTATQARRIARERDRAERVSQFLVELFRESDPNEARGNSITAREVLDRGAKRIDDELKDEPQVQAQLMHTMGMVYVSLGLFPEAERLLDRAVAQHSALYGEHDAQSLASRKELASLYRHQGHLRESVELFREVYEGSSRELGPDHVDTIQSLNGIAVVLGDQGQHEESGKIFDEVLERSRRALGENHNLTVWAMHNVAENRHLRGQREEALRMFDEALEARRRLSGDDHPDTLWLKHNVARTLFEVGQHDRAETMMKEVLEQRRSVLGEEHAHTLMSLNVLGGMFLGQGRLDDARAVLERAMEIATRTLGEEHPRTTAAMNNLAAVFMQLKRREEAAQLLFKLYGIRQRLHGEESQQAADVAYNLACLAALGGRQSEALDWLRKARHSQGASSMAEDPDLQSLRGDPDFEKLVALGKASG